MARQIMVGCQNIHLRLDTSRAGKACAPPWVPGVPGMGTIPRTGHLHQADSCHWVLGIIQYTDVLIRPSVSPETGVKRTNKEQLPGTFRKQNFLLLLPHGMGPFQGASTTSHPGVPCDDPPCPQEEACPAT